MGTELGLSSRCLWGEGRKRVEPDGVGQGLHADPQASRAVQVLESGGGQQGMVEGRNLGAQGGRSGGDTEEAAAEVVGVAGYRGQAPELTGWSTSGEQV